MDIKIVPPDMFEAGTDPEHDVFPEDAVGHYDSRKDTIWIFPNIEEEEILDVLNHELIHRRLSIDHGEKVSALYDKLNRWLIEEKLKEARDKLITDKLWPGSLEEI